MYKELRTAVLFVVISIKTYCERSEAEPPKAASLRERAHSETHILETESIRNFFNIDFFEKSE